VKKVKKMKKLIIGADGSGYELKEAVKAYLNEAGISYDDVGAQSLEDSVPYYTTACRAAKGISEGSYEKGLLFCGTGMGMSIIANKHKGIYASVVESVYAAEKCRAINNSNILCMGGFIVGSEMAIEMVKTFLKTEFTENMGGFKDFLKQAYADIQNMENELF